MHPSAPGLRETFLQMLFIQNQNCLFWVAVKQWVMTLHETKPKQNETNKQSSVYVKMLSLSSAERLGISPTASQENTTDDILCTSMFLLYNPVGGVCWTLSMTHPMVNGIILGTDSEFHYEHMHFFLYFQISLFSFFLHLHLPSFMAILAMTYGHISLLSPHSSTSFPFFASCIKFTGFSSSLHNPSPKHSRTFLSPAWDGKWRLSTHHRATQVSRQYRAFSHIRPILIICRTHVL